MVKFLCVSDTTMPQLENAANLRRQYSDVDAVISCGDMPVTYLDYISSVLSVDLLYVRGNHDEEYMRQGPGGIDLHMNFIEFKGVRVMGLEGCVRYNNSPIQYSQSEMRMNVLKLAPRLRYERWRHGSGLDLFVTHAPPRGIHDLEDLPHQGFESFLGFLRWYRPRYMVHGHVHTWDRRRVVQTDYESTRIFNINPYMVLEI